MTSDEIYSQLFEFELLLNKSSGKRYHITIPAVGQAEITEVIAMNKHKTVVSGTPEQVLGWCQKHIKVVVE